MDNKILQSKENSGGIERLKQDNDNVLDAKELDEDLHVDNTALEVVESVEVSDEGDGTFSEKTGKYVQKAYTSSDDSSVKTGTTIAAMPPIEEMIKQTVAAIENELHNTEVQMKNLMKNKSTTPHMINDKVIRIRFLNGLLNKMKRVAKLTEDFIVGLWKQYVKRTG